METKAHSHSTQAAINAVNKLECFYLISQARPPITMTCIYGYQPIMFCCPSQLVDIDHVTNHAELIVLMFHLGGLAGYQCISCFLLGFLADSA